MQVRNQLEQAIKIEILFKNLKIINIKIHKKKKSSNNSNNFSNSNNNSSSNRHNNNRNS